VGYNLIFIVLLIGAFWFLLVRPQRRRALDQQELFNSLEPGDEVVSAGGLYGVVRSVDGDELRVEVADGVTVRMARRAVTGIVERDEEPEEAPEDEPPGNEPEEPPEAAADGRGTAEIRQIHDESTKPS
jgi:preprotein translocase subunit YajC